MIGGWEIKKIGDICDLMTGGTPSRDNPQYFGGMVKWLVSGDIHQRDIYDCEGRITDEGLANSNAKYLPVNSVLIALNGQGKTRGTVAILRTLATCNQSLVSIFPKDTNRLLPEYIFLNLHGRYQEIRQITGDGGNDRRGLNMPLLRNIKIPFPPLPVQKRIVAILDEAFAGIDRAIANTEKNLKNARELFESYLNEVFTRKGDGWIEKRLGQLGKITSSKRIFKEEYTDIGIPFYRTKEIKEKANGLEISTELFIAKERYNEIKNKFGVPQPGDILLTAIGTIGEIWVVEGEDAFYFKDGNVLWLKDFVSVNSYFLRYALMSFVEELNRLSRGSAYNALPIEKLKEHAINLPSIDEQLQLVSRLDDLMVSQRKLEIIYQQKLEALSELKQSILQKAFTGELTEDLPL